MSRPTFCYRFGTAEFDEARFELRVAGLPVDVERRALEVLAYLLRHAGEVVTKEELLREVWAGRVTVDKVLTNAIAKLRRALGEAHAGCIATQARLGYRFDGEVTRRAVGRQAGRPLALAAGEPVPGRPSFVLQRPLGQGGASGLGGSGSTSEVWRAVHPKTHEARVYKFATDADRLRALQREVTLLRVLHEGAEDPSHFVELLDWHFETPPFFIELRDGGPSLAEWAASHLAALSTEARVALFLQIAEAVAAAHGLGVLHKDLKPANVLVAGPADAPKVRLTDFGSGRLLEPDLLAQMGITRLGMTVQDGDVADAGQGTPLYLAPELFSGQSPTVRSDVFALGLLLYQLLAGRIGQPMASGWEAHIADPLLREDLQQATAGDPHRRLAGAAELVDRLRRLDRRREDAAQARRQRELAQHTAAALARARARRPYLLALLAVLLAGMATTAWLLHDALQARNAARLALARTQALTWFLNEDLIGRANPLVSAKGPDTTLREVLLSGRERVSGRFARQPQVGASIHVSLAASLLAVDQSAEAEEQARLALALLEPVGETRSATALQARAVLVRVLAQRGQVSRAQAELEALERLGAGVTEVPVQAQTAAARASLSLARSEFTQAALDLRVAIDRLSGREPTHIALRDALRLELVHALALARQHEAARDEGRRLIEDAHLRPEDHTLLVALTRLSLARAQGEDHDAAQALLLAAQPVVRDRLGEHHPRHIRLHNELFAVAFRRADWPRALDHAQAVHERVRARLGDGHPSTWVSLLNWGRTLTEAGRPAEALDKVRRAHGELLQRVGAASPQTQDAAFVLALTQLDLGLTPAAQALIEQLDAGVLESGRATGLWQAGIDALRGMAAQQRGERDAARRLLDGALHALKDEATLAQPSRLFLSAQQAQARVR